MTACRGKLCLGATMPLAFALFGKSQPGRFFAGPTLALDVGGSTAWLAGHANPEELAGFLAFCGCEAVVLDEAECPPPTGWKRAKTHSVFGLAPGRQLPLPEADASLWQSLAKTQNLPPEKQRICSSLTGPQNGTTFTLSSAPSAAGALPGSGRWNGKETSSALWEPTRWQMVRHTWPAVRPWKLCGAKASAGGSSSRWRMPSPPKAGCLSSCAAPSGCISIPGWALRRWGSMHDMKYNNN